MKPTPTTKICKHCNKEFTRPLHQAKKMQFCSKKCCYAHRTLYKVCPQCGEKYKARVYSVYCSRACRNKANVCEFTQEHRARLSASIKGKNAGEKNPAYGKYGKDSWSYGTRRTEEQKRKMSESRIGRFFGENSNNWKGGITPENKKIRASLEYTLWRKACMERDKFTCQATGQIGGELTVHHINNFADFPELRTSIENGITLSKLSHIDFHKIYGRKNNTKEQLEEFLDAGDKLSNIQIRNEVRQ